MEQNRYDGLNPKLQVAIPPNIGLDSDTRNSVIEILNTTLADESVLTVKTRSAHWNVSGAGFFELHTLFDLQYKQLNDISNEVAERVRVLGGIAIGSLQEFLKNARLDEKPEDIPDMLELLADHEAIIRFLREDAKKCSEEHEDEVTRDFLVGVLYEHEKMAWILRSHIEPQLTGDERKKSKVNPYQR